MMASPLRATRVAEPAGCGWNPRRANPPVWGPMVRPGRHIGASGRRPGSPTKIDENHVGASTSPGLAVVVCAAGYPRSCQRGARFGLLPRTGRNPIHQTGRNRAEALPFVVAHVSASSIVTSRLRLARAPLRFGKWLAARLAPEMVDDE